MKYLKLYNSKEEYESAQVPITKYINRVANYRSNPIMEKEGDEYIGSFEKDYMHDDEEWVTVTHTYHISKLETPYIVLSTEESSIEVEALEIVVNDEVVTIVFEGDDYHQEVTGNTASVTIQGTPVNGYYLPEDFNGEMYFDFCTGSTLNPEMINVEEKCYAVKHEIEDDKGEKIMTVCEGLQSEAYNLNDNGKMLVPKSYDTQEYYELDFVDGGTYYVAFNHHSEYVGRYEKGTEKVTGIKRYNNGRFETHTGYILTNAETGKMWLESDENYSSYWYELDGMDEQDPTMYKIGDSYLFYGFVTCVKPKPVVGFETSVVPGVSYDKTNVRYNNRGFDFPNSGNYTWQEVGFTDNDYSRLLGLYKQGNVCGYEYGIRMEGELSKSRDFGYPYNFETETPGLIFNRSSSIDGTGYLCDGPYVFINKDTKIIHIGWYRCV